MLFYELLRNTVDINWKKYGRRSPYLAAEEKGGGEEGDEEEEREKGIRRLTYRPTDAFPRFFVETCARRGRRKG